MIFNDSNHLFNNTVELQFYFTTSTSSLQHSLNRGSCQVTVWLLACRVDIIMLPCHCYPTWVFPGNESQTRQHNKLLVYLNIRPYARMSKLKKNYFLNKQGEGTINGGVHVWLLFNTLGGSRLFGTEEYTTRWIIPVQPNSCRSSLEIFNLIQLFGRILR